MSFHDVRFPEDIGRGATGGPVFRTTVVETGSGFEQRNMEWDEPRYEWAVTLEAWNPERLAELIAFFNARSGRAYGFRFMDATDFFAGMKWIGFEPEYDEPVTIGIGNGVADTFKLVKRYTSGPTTRVRRITRPVAATVKIYFDGVELVSGWTLDDSTGTVSFASAPVPDVVVGWAGEFDVPARFDTDEMQFNVRALQNGSWNSVTIKSIREAD